MPVRVAELRGLPILGKWVDFRRDRLALHLECMAAGDLVRFPMLHRSLVVVTSPELVHTLLVEHDAALSKGPGLGMFGRFLLGDGLLTADGDVWRRKRKLLAPAFAPRRIAGYGAAMAALADVAAARWRDGQLVDVADEMMRLTLAIVGRTLFDADIEGDAAVIGDAVTEAMEFMIRNLTVPLPVSWPIRRNRRARDAVARLDEIVFRIVRERRAAGGDRGDVLSMLLAARDDDGSGLTDRDVRDEILTLMLAGHETTANALAWTWYLLAQHDDAYARLLDEVDRVVGDRVPTVDDLPRLSWTLQCIEEAMRLYPPAYAIGRGVTRAIELPETTIRPGEIVIVPIRAIHRRPDLWPDPLAFRPERMAEAAKRARPRYAYLPFGAGPRVCIGNHFALTEAHLLVATISRRWRLRLAQRPDITPEPLVTLRPRGGVHVEVIARPPQL